VIASRLPAHAWPDDRLLVVAVDIERGERQVFDRTSGQDLVDAVAASLGGMSDASGGGSACHAGPT